MEVMGLMLGEFVDDYTVRVIDVFAMPQSGTVCIFFPNFISFFISILLWLSFYAHANTWLVEYSNLFLYLNFCQGVSVEAVDPVFQAKMLDMLKQTGR